ncbi:MAG: glycosyltransferase [Nostoc sp.]|uniref:glycosyltransferase n=1 Tax=Nostoc sp. TaxID=1180 RepID=UPI002FF77D27
MRITIVTGGSLGDLQPYVALGLGLQQVGHVVKLVAFTNQARQEFISQWGLDCVCMDIHVEEFLTEPFWKWLHPNPAYVFDNIRSVLQPLEDSYLSQLLDLCQGAEAIILGHFALLGYDIIEKLGVPCYAACIPPISPTNAFPHPAAPIELRLGGIYNRLTYFLFDKLLWRSVRQPINQWRQEVLKLTPIAWWLSPVHRLHRQKLPFLYGYSPSLLPKPSEWPDWLHVTGYWFIDCPENWQPPVDLVDFIAIGSPPVYVGVRGLTDLELKLVLSAIAQTGQRCILQVPGELNGENSLSEDFDLSDKVFKLSEWVPFDWLFPQMAALVHHGGAGTLAYGVRSGVPSISIPNGDDRFFWAHRVAELGLGPKPILPHQLSAQRLADAIRLATNDQSMQACAAAMGRKIQAENGVVRAIEAFHRHLPNKV